MKEVRIDGKRYNINTAKLIATWDNDLPYMDFCYLKETLYRKRTGEFFLYGEYRERTGASFLYGEYRKRTGEFFLYGEGGARAKYGRVDEDGRSYIVSEKIIPLTDAEAKTWLKAYEEGDWTLRDWDEVECYE